MNMFKTPFYSYKGIVVSENPLASINGLDILRHGGTAVDASVTVSLSLAVTIPHLGGIGGDFFAMIYDSSRDEIYHINGSGYAGSGLSIEMLKNRGFSHMPKKGVYSITVPGMVDALYEMWRKYGSMEWSNLLEKPYEMALNGFPLSYTLARGLKAAEEDLADDPGSRVTYPIGKNLSTGSKIKFVALARLIDVLKDDPRSFYEGSVMENIVSYLNREDNIFSEEDFKSYHAEWMDPITLDLYGYRIYETPPNTQGITTLQLLKLLENAGLNDIPPNSSRRILLSLDLFKVVYCLRDKYVTDGRCMDISIDELLSDDFLADAQETCQYIPRIKGGSDTTYFAVIDTYGNIVSGIQSLFYPFGSMVTEPSFGITFNCRANSFSLDPRHINCLEPGKKPMHTLSIPIIIGEDKVYAHGLSGGHFRPQLHSEILTNMFVYGMDPQEALEYPRFLWDLENDTLILEKGYEIEDLVYSNIEIREFGSRLGVAATVSSNSEGLKAGYVDIRGEMFPVGLV